MSMLRVPLLLLFLLPVADQPVPKLPVGKDTTYVTGPLDKEGYIDYEAALNDRLGKGISPETNANVLLWKAIGPWPASATRMPAEFFKRLGIEEPPEHGEYFISLRAVLADSRIPDDEVLTIQAQLDQAIKRVWAANDCPQLARWLKANEKPLAVVLKATKRPHYYNPLIAPRSGSGPGGLMGASLAGVHKCRDFASALGARAMLRTGEGKLDEAWQDLLGCHRLGRLVARGGTSIDVLVGIAIGQTASNADLAYLEHAELTAKQARAALKDLQRLSALAPVADTMDLASRCMFLDFLQEIRRSGLDNPAGVRGGQPTRKPNVKDEQLLASLDWGIILRTCNRWYDRVVTALRVEERATRQKEIDRSVTDLRALKKETMGRGAMIGAVINEIAQGVGPKRAVAEKVGDVLVYYMLPAFSRVQDAADRDEQVQRNLHVAFALANYQRDRGRYPAKLDELVPRYLPAIPDDLFSGKALIYRPSEKGYLVYSVGPNGIDEGGSTLEDNPPGDDLSVRMPLPRLKQEK